MKYKFNHHLCCLLSLFVFFLAPITQAANNPNQNLSVVQSPDWPTCSVIKNGEINYACISTSNNAYEPILRQTKLDNYLGDGLSFEGRTLVSLKNNAGQANKSAVTIFNEQMSRFVPQYKQVVTTQKSNKPANVKIASDNYTVALAVESNHSANAYIYDRKNNQWQLEGNFILNNIDKKNPLNFLELSQNTMVAGSEDFLEIFHRDADGWKPDYVINKKNIVPNNFKLLSLDVDDDIIVAGYQDSSKINQVVVYERIGNTWDHQALLGPQYTFGEQVAVNNGTIIIAYNGKNANKSKLFIYKKSGAVWGNTAELINELDFNSSGIASLDFNDYALAVGDLNKNVHLLLDRTNSGFIQVLTLGNKDILFRLEEEKDGVESSLVGPNFSDKMIGIQYSSFPGYEPPHQPVNLEVIEQKSSGSISLASAPEVPLIDLPQATPNGGANAQASIERPEETTIILEQYNQFYNNAENGEILSAWWDRYAVLDKDVDDIPEGNIRDLLKFVARANEVATASTVSNWNKLSVAYQTHSILLNQKAQNPYSGDPTALVSLTNSMRYIWGSKTFANRTLIDPLGHIDPAVTLTEENTNVTVNVVGLPGDITSIQGIWKNSQWDVNRIMVGDFEHLTTDSSMANSMIIPPTSSFYNIPGGHGTDTWTKYFAGQLQHELDFKFSNTTYNIYNFDNGTVGTNVKGNWFIVLKITGLLIHPFTGYTSDNQNDGAPNILSPQSIAVGGLQLTPSGIGVFVGKCDGRVIKNVPITVTLPAGINRMYHLKIEIIGAYRVDLSVFQ